jgi:hypothetical protein
MRTVHSFLLATSIAATLAGCAGTPESRAAAAKPARTSPAEEKRIEDLRRFIDESDPIAQLDRGGRDEPRATYPAPGEADSFATDLDAAISAIEPPTDLATTKVFKEQPADAAAPVADPPPAVTPAPVATSAFTVPAASATPAPESVIGPPSPAAAPEESPDARLTRQLAEIRQTIAELRAETASPASEAVELLAMQLLRADSVTPEMESLSSRMTPGQRRAMTTLQELLTELRDPETGASALDARRISRLLTEHADKLDDDRPVKITASALCTSVESYGCYTRFSDYTFLQGRPQPAIVYVAVENFTERSLSAQGTPSPTITPISANPAAPGAAWPKPTPRDRKAPTTGYVVELTESIAIHNDADDLVVWRAPDASIRDVSRDKRQDYYLVQRVELPARLTLGKYTIKVTVRDTVSGATDEAIIPIQIVADPVIAGKVQAAATPPR